MERTQSLRDALPGIIDKYSIKTFLDAPCGDFYWMKSLVPNLSISYIGADIVKDLVSANQRAFGTEKIRFTHLDLTVGPIPAADVLFCRDCLFHLSYIDIALVLKNFLISDCRFFMTTSHINRNNFANSDIETGGWRWFDLFKTPFNFSETYVEAIVDGGGDRLMCMWRMGDVKFSIETYINTIKGDA